MSFVRAAVVSLSLSALAACASSGPAPTAAVTSPEAAPALADPPFTALQIRQATQPGRTYVWRVTQPVKPDAPATLRRAHFATATDEGADLVFETLAEDGHALEPAQKSHARWTDLESHGRFPADALHVTSGSVTVPAGTFDAWIYEVATPDGHVAVFWFAKDLPGAPVRIVERAGSDELEVRELLSHTVDAP